MTIDAGHSEGAMEQEPCPGTHAGTSTSGLHDVKEEGAADGVKSLLKVQEGHSFTPQGSRAQGRAHQLKCIHTVSDAPPRQVGRLLQGHSRCHCEAKACGQHLSKKAVVTVEESDGPIVGKQVRSPTFVQGHHCPNGELRGLLPSSPHSREQGSQQRGKVVFAQAPNLSWGAIRARCFAGGGVAHGCPDIGLGHSRAASNISQVRGYECGASSDSIHNPLCGVGVERRCGGDASKVLNSQPGHVAAACDDLCIVTEAANEAAALGR